MYNTWTSALSHVGLASGVSHLILITAPGDPSDCAHLRNEKIDWERFRHPSPYVRAEMYLNSGLHGSDQYVVVSQSYVMRKQTLY